jgi:alkylation response protein AidB-like acyl-CoA dehydrogenase
MADYPVMERLTQKVHDARALREIILAHRASTDAARQIAQPVVEAMAGLGLFRALVPASAGGEAWDLPIWLRVVEKLSTVDGAVGWVAGVGGPSTPSSAAGSRTTQHGRCSATTPLALSPGPCSQEAGRLPPPVATSSRASGHLQAQHPTLPGFMAACS